MSRLRYYFFTVLLSASATGCSFTTAIVTPTNAERFPTAELCLYAYQAEIIPGWYRDKNEDQTIFAELHRRGFGSPDSCTGQGYASLLCGKKNLSPHEEKFCKNELSDEFRDEQRYILAKYSISAGKTSSETSSFLKDYADKTLISARRCGERTVASIDDGRSDASTIATALANTCGKEHRKSLEVWAYANGLTGMSFDLFVTRGSRAEEKRGFYLPVVLQFRRGIQEFRERGPRLPPPEQLPSS